MKRIIIAAAVTATLIALPLAAQEKEQSKRRQVFVTGERVEVLDGDKAPQVFWLRSGGAYLGVSTTNLSDELRAHFGAPAEQGVMIAKVHQDTPAARAGLQAGDIITAIDGKKISSTWDMNKLLSGRKKDEQLRIDFIRNRASQQTFAAVEERQAPQFLDPGELPRRLELEMGLERLGETLERIPLESMRGRIVTVPGCADLQARVKALEERIRELEKKQK